MCLSAIQLTSVPALQFKFGAAACVCEAPELKANPSTAIEHKTRE